MSANMKSSIDKPISKTDLTSLLDEGWQEWNGQFFLPKHKHGFKYVQILFKGPKNHVDIVIDDMVLEELPLEKDWLQEVKSRTEQLRKRHTTVRYDEMVFSGEPLYLTYNALWWWISVIIIYSS